MTLILQLLLSLFFAGQVTSFRYVQTLRHNALTRLAVTEFSEFSAGQEYEGKIVSALPFGVFVDISEGTNVLLPRSMLSKGTYEKLKSMADNKNEEKIKIEVI